jgi:integrase
MRFPKRIKHRGRVYATIYAKSEAYPMYRVVWSVAGKRRVKAFSRSTGKDSAQEYAEALSKELSKGSQSTLLTSAQATDALAALEVLQGLQQATGRKASLLAVASEFADASVKLNGHSIREAVESFLRNNSGVKRRGISQAVEDFIAEEEPRTSSNAGERPQLSAKYAYNRAIMLRRFAATFPNTAICDLSKEHLATFINGLGKMKSDKTRNHRAATSAKSRNHHRGAVRQFFTWCAEKDYLAPTHRLLEGKVMRSEKANTAEVEFYTPKELRMLLECAEGPMRALIAIGGLAGLRTAELLRLDWSEVWRVDGHIDITKGKAKNRQRRYVTIPPALQQWLAPYREFKVGHIWQGHEISFQRDLSAICDRAGVKRRENGLRHGFCTYHYALHSDENLTAKEAGHSPSMFHAHYKEPVTKQQGEAWFAVAPAKAENVIPIPQAVCP